MKSVTAVRMTYDATVGRIEPGETYLVEDDKAERWVNAGIATEGKAPPPRPEPEPEPEGRDEPEEEDDPRSEGEEDNDDLAADARKLHDAGDSERTIAGKLGISRTRVHSLLAH